MAFYLCFLFCEVFASIVLVNFSNNLTPSWCKYEIITQFFNLGRGFCEIFFVVTRRLPLNPLPLRDSEINITLHCCICLLKCSGKGFNSWLLVGFSVCVWWKKTLWFGLRKPNAWPTLNSTEKSQQQLCSALIWLMNPQQFYIKFFVILYSTIRLLSLLTNMIITSVEISQLIIFLCFN